MKTINVASAMHKWFVRLKIEGDFKNANEVLGYLKSLHEKYGKEVSDASV